MCKHFAMHAMHKIFMQCIIALCSTSDCVACNAFDWKRPCRDVVLYYKIRDSSTAISDWQIYPQLGSEICLHTRTLPHGCHHHSCSHAQSCVSVSLMWSFGTIIKPRINVFDCRRQVKGIRCHWNWFVATSDTFDLSVTLCHVRS